MKGPLPILLHCLCLAFPHKSNHLHLMPIAPITGKLRKRLLLDLSTALGFGVAAGYAYWYVWLIFLTSSH